MAQRSWARVLLVAVGVAVLAGAGQLGVAYGLGVLRFARTFDVRDEWSAQVTWVVWFAMVATVLGALAGDRQARRYASAGGPGTAISVTLGACVGAAAVGPLSMLPAGSAVVPSVATAPVVGASALIGILVGALTAVAALLEPAVRWNVLGVTGACWLLAVVSVAPSLGPADPLVTLRLGVFEPAWLSPNLVPRLAVVSIPALALVAGAVAGGVARWRGTPAVPAAACGVAGPVLLASAYLIAGPGDGVGRLQDAPYWGAVVAIGAGLLGSVLAVLVHRSEHRHPAAGPDRAAPAAPRPGQPARATPQYRAEPAFEPPPEPTPRLATPQQRRPTPQPYVPLGPRPVPPRPPDQRPAAPLVADLDVLSGPSAAPAGRAGPAPDGAPRAGGRSAAPGADGFRRTGGQNEGDQRQPEAAPRGRNRWRGSRSGPTPDDEYVDWVNGLGGGPDDQRG